MPYGGYEHTGAGTYDLPADYTPPSKERRMPMQEAMADAQVPENKRPEFEDVLGRLDAVTDQNRTLLERLEKLAGGTDTLYQMLTGESSVDLDHLQDDDRDRPGSPASTIHGELVSRLNELDNQQGSIRGVVSTLERRLEAIARYFGGLR